MRGERERWRSTSYQGENSKQDSKYGGALIEEGLVYSLEYNYCYTHFISVSIFTDRFHSFHLPIQQQISLIVCRFNGKWSLHLPIQRQIKLIFANLTANLLLHLPIQRQIRLTFADSTANSLTFADSTANTSYICWFIR